MGSLNLPDPAEVARKLAGPMLDDMMEKMMENHWGLGKKMDRPVKVFGLSSKPRLNGRNGYIVSASKDRYGVQLLPKDDDCKKPISIKKENCEDLRGTPGKDAHTFFVVDKNQLVEFNYANKLCYEGYTIGLDGKCKPALQMGVKDWVRGKYAQEYHNPLRIEMITLKEAIEDDETGGEEGDELDEKICIKVKVSGIFGRDPISGKVDRRDIILGWIDAPYRSLGPTNVSNGLGGEEVEHTLTKDEWASLISQMLQHFGISPRRVHSLSQHQFVDDQAYVCSKVGIPTTIPTPMSKEETRKILEDQFPGVGLDEDNNMISPSPQTHVDRIKKYFRRPSDE